MRDTLTKMIMAAVRAPSGDNKQHWRFEVGGETIKLYHTAAEAPMFDHQHCATLFSCGAVIENMTVAAQEYGYNCAVVLFPEPSNETLVATLTFAPSSGGGHSPLFSAIDTRATNRNPHNHAPLTKDEKATLYSVASGTDLIGTIKLIEDRDTMRAVAKASTTYESLIFQNRELHDALFGNIRWTKEEAERTKDGLYIRRLGLSALDQQSIGMLKSWSILGVLQRLGIARIIGAVTAQKSVKKYLTSGAMCAVIMPTRSREAFVNAGRLGERLWLTATSLGLQAQPISGVLFLANRLLDGKTASYSETQAELLRSAVAAFKDCFDERDGEVLFVLRIGKGAPQKVRSHRKEPTIDYRD